MFSRELKTPQVATFENAHAFYDEAKVEIESTFSLMAQLGAERQDIKGLSGALESISHDLDQTAQSIEQGRTRLMREEFDEDHFIISGGDRSPDFTFSMMMCSRFFRVAQNSKLNCCAH